MANNERVNKDNDSRQIITMIMLIGVLMLCTTGATYAYFAISATDNIATGTAATAGIILTNTTSNTSAAPLTMIAPTNQDYKSKPMVPQISYTGSTNVLKNALAGADKVNDDAAKKDKCVDHNGNVICKAYSFVVRNIGTSNVDIRGSIKFTYTDGSTFNNLRWQLMENESLVEIDTAIAGTTYAKGVPVKASTSAVYFNTSNLSLAPNATQQYWIIVWIEEMGYDQGTNADNDKKDVGTFNMTVEFKAYNESGTSIGGVTSTITS